MQIPNRIKITNLEKAANSMPESTQMEYIIGIFVEGK